MKKLISVVLLASIFVAMICMSFQECQASSKRSNLLSIRIDAGGCVWWHERRASMENLPRPLWIESDSGCILDYPALYAVLEDYIDRYREAYIWVLVHPECHYMHLDNFLSVVVGINTSRLQRIDLLVSETKRHSANATGGEAEGLDLKLQRLENDKMLGPDVVLSFWSPRDDRIFRFMSDSTGVAAPPAGDVPANHQFMHRYEIGHWEDKFPDWFTVDPWLPPPLTPTNEYYHVCDSLAAHEGSK